MSSSVAPKPSPKAIVSKAGIKNFSEFLNSRKAAINSVGASFVRPERLIKVVLACVTRTPKLLDCTQESIFRSALQSAELGLEPGSALGEAYLVPYKEQCQLIVGYRGLISLAYRSGHVKSIQSREVYVGDEFEWEMGLESKLMHRPCGEVDANKITHAYCVVHLLDGGIIYDVMTRQEIDRIRARSRSGSNGPWVSDFAEMAKKTVARRTLKYVPMSIEMSKAMAVDNSADTGDNSDTELDSIDIIDGTWTDVDDNDAQSEPRRTGVDAVKEKLGVDTTADAQPSQDPATMDPKPELAQRCKNLLEVLFQTEALRNTFRAKSLGETSIDDASVDQLLVLLEALEAQGKAKAS